jgi:membrane protease YdiL (CAAX protease family)
MLDPANADAVKMVQLVSSAIMFLLPAFVFALVVNNRPARHLGLRTKFNWAQVGIITVIVFVAFALSGALGELTTQIPIAEKWEKKFKAWEKLYVDQVMIMANMKNIGEYLYTLLVIAVAPAIFEELLFRGALQQLMVKWTKVAWLGILITSLLFSAVHFSYYGFFARTALGLILGYMFYYSKSLWLPIIAHFINNGFAVTAMYYMNRQGKLSTTTLDEKFPVWYGVIALAIIVVLFIIYRNEGKKLGTFYLDNTATKSNNPFEGDQFDFEQRRS